MRQLTILPAPDIARYSPRSLAFAVRAWPMRAAEELRSCLVFRTIAAASRSSHIATEWIEQFVSAARDEAMHARLCAVVGRQLRAAAPQFDRGPVQRRLIRLTDMRMRLAALLLVEVAIGESISSAMFRAGARRAVEPLTHAALSTIVRDEAKHQRLGWQAFASLWSDLSERERTELWDDMRTGFAAMEQQIAAPALRRLETAQPFDPEWAALGVLEPATRVEVFYDALERIVLPRLTKVGLDGHAAWRDRYR